MDFLFFPCLPTGADLALPLLGSVPEEFLNGGLQLCDWGDASRKLQRSVLGPRDRVGSSRKGSLRAGRTVFNRYTLLRLKPEKRRRPFIGLRVRLTAHDGASVTKTSLIGSSPRPRGSL